MLTQIEFTIDRIPTTIAMTIAEDQLKIMKIETLMANTIIREVNGTIGIEIPRMMMLENETTIVTICLRTVRDEKCTTLHRSVLSFLKLKIVAMTI